MTGTATDSPPSPDRLIEIALDTATIARAHQQIEHEREVAIYDLMDANSFALTERLGAASEGPYRLKLGLVEDRLVFAVAREDSEPVLSHPLSLTPFRKILRDYFMLLDTYYQAVRSATPARIEAIDANRRSLHDEGSQLLRDRLAGKIDVDFDTARRLFTLLAALHWKG